MVSGALVSRPRELLSPVASVQREWTRRSPSTRIARTLPTLVRLILACTAVPLASQSVSTRGVPREASAPRLQARCAQIATRISSGSDVENAAALLELQSCNETSGAVLSHLWSTAIQNDAIFNAVIRSSVSIRDARTAEAALACVQNRARPMLQRAAAMTVIVSYLDSTYEGRVLGSPHLGPSVQLVRVSHPSNTDGSQPISDQLRTRMWTVVEKMRTEEKRGMIGNMLLGFSQK